MRHTRWTTPWGPIESAERGTGRGGSRGRANVRVQRDLDTLLSREVGGDEEGGVDDTGLTDYSESFDFDRLRGSSVLAQVAACIMGVDQPDRSSEGRRVSCGKANLGPLPEPFGFTITDAGLTFGPPPDDHHQTSRLDEAKAFLRRALADGPRPANEIKEGAKEEGISEHTLRRARADLCVAHRQPGVQTRWLWALNVESERNVG
ncbi:MAG: hypothetical protein FJX75_25345 [Armatimonadetes bacterium]|nr:hypothetical protein [Armatimonadota bacterium]